MIVDSTYFSQHDGTPQEWKLEECTFGDVNLIVGENASGKSKILNVISNLGNLLSGERGPFLSANYRVVFNKNSKKLDYVLKCERGMVTEEKLDIDGNNLLFRGADGRGQIYYEQEQLNKMVDFQAPSNQVVSVARRDAIQHSFLEYLYDWGKSIRLYQFGSDLGKRNFTVPLKAKEGQPPPSLNQKNTEMVIAMFIEGQKKFSTEFTGSILHDMKEIGYELTEISTAPPASILFEGMPVEVVGLYVKEADLSGTTDQNEMSQGMFRALSLFIQITYSQFTNAPACVLVDDIGEGLDYNRSTALVKLLIEKAKQKQIQLIMATNDRFVMNNVPLEYWSVIQRLGNISRLYNYKNSPKLFKEFELTGLNNFDFFSTKYYLKDNRQN